MTSLRPRLKELNDNPYINGTSTEGYSYQGTGGSVSTSYWIFRKPCTKEVFEKAVEEGIKK